jgi:NCS1 family nucleobase:cation symporter-1
MGSSDPTQWMLPIVGPGLAAVLLAFICFANLTSIAGMVYGAVQTFAQHFGSRVQRFGWAKTAAVCLGICGICVFFTETLLYDRFFAFLAWTQAAVVAAVGVTLADYLILRGRHISLSGLYDVKENSPYGYWHGVNYVALLALLAGSLVYISLLNPVTLNGAPMFPYVGASIPALLVAIGVHLALTRWLVIPADKGSYSNRRAPLPSTSLEESKT